MTQALQRTSQDPSQPVDLSLPEKLRNVIERSYLNYVEDLSFQLHTQPWRDLQVNLRLAKLTDLTITGLEGSTTSLLSGLNASQVCYVIVVVGDRQGASFYLGCIPSDSSRLSGDDAFNIFRNWFQTNQPGARLDLPLPYEAVQERILKPIEEYQHVACLTGVPAQAEHLSQAAGLELLMDGLRGENYLLLMLAEPIGEQDIEQLLTKCRLMSTEMHTYVRQSAQNSRQVNVTTGHQSTQTAGTSFGLSFLTLANLSTNIQRSYADSHSISEGQADSLSVERFDKEMGYLETRLDALTDRIARGKGIGLWSESVFLLARSRPTLSLGMSLLHGIASGERPGTEPVRSLSLNNRLDQLQKILVQFRLPAFIWPGRVQHPFGPTMDRLATIVNSDELSALFCPPTRQVVGVRVLPDAVFNVNPPPVQAGVDLGQVVYQGQRLPVTAQISLNSLTRHTFVTGVTGAGKTNTCFSLLSAVSQAGIPFLVIEPAKQEYRQLEQSDLVKEAIRVYTLGDESQAPLRLNPFQFVPGFPLLTHIDYLKAIFNASFPMYASMPYILEEAILGIYEDYGWDITTGKNRYADPPAESHFFPTLQDLFERIDRVVAEKRYAERLTQDITAALKTRIKSLMVGGKGKMLNTRFALPIAELFTRPTILELRRIGNDDERAFLIALLLVWLYEYCETRGPSASLRHLTLIEEAHRILQNVPPVSNEMIGARSQAVSTFSNMLAEIRAYGEGMVIVDQIPAKLTPDVVKNTDLKILHRLVAADDRQFVGQAMTLSEDQIEQAARLNVGEAIVYYEAARAAMLLKFPAVVGSEQKPGSASPARGSADQLAVRLDDTCSMCAAICRFGSSTSPDPELSNAIREALISLLISPKAEWLPVWRSVLQKAYQQAHARSQDRKELSARLYCLFARSGTSVLEDVFAWGSELSASPSPVQIQLKVLFAQALYSLLDSHPDIDPLSRLTSLASSLKAHPAFQHPQNPKEGCAICRNQCLYGYWFEHLDHSKARQVMHAHLDAVKNSAEDELLAVTRQTISPLAPQALNDIDGFSFCILTRFGLNMNNLKKLQAKSEHARKPTKKV